MRAVLHVLPHSGGGAEKYIRLLSRLPELEQRRIELSAGRTPAAALASLPLHYPRLVTQLRGADLLHVHGDAALLLTSPMLARRPTLWTTHGLHLLRRRSAIAGPLRAAMSRAQVTICTSRAEADELTAIAPSLRPRVEVIHNGVELPPHADAALRAHARAELGLADDEVAALFLGELEQRKAPLDAVAAIRTARAAGVRAVLLVAGRGRLAQAVAAQGGEAVQLLGYREDTPRLFAASDLFIAPAAREGLSFALLEAMAHGLAIVASDGPGNPEAVGGAGIVVPAGDRAELGDAVLALARDRAWRSSLGVAARARAASEFDLSGMLARTQSAYERALREPGPDAGGAPA